MQQKQTYSLLFKPIRFISAKINMTLVLMLWCGGLVGQADAITLAIARALCKIDQALAL
jgi:ribosomal protein S9